MRAEQIFLNFKKIAGTALAFYRRNMSRRKEVKKVLS
jgi:hypothetical protein